MMQRLGTGVLALPLLLALACGKGPSTESSTPGSAPPAPPTVPETASIDGAAAAPSATADAGADPCMDACMQRNMMRAVDIESIRRDCQSECSGASPEPTP